LSEVPPGAVMSVATRTPPIGLDGLVEGEPLSFRPFPSSFHLPPLGVAHRLLRGGKPAVAEDLLVPLAAAHRLFCSADPTVAVCLFHRRCSRCLLPLPLPKGKSNSYIVTSVSVWDCCSMSSPARSRVGSAVSRTLRRARPTPAFSLCSTLHS